MTSSATKKYTHRSTNTFDASITTHRKPSQGFCRSVGTPLYLPLTSGQPFCVAICSILNRWLHRRRAAIHSFTIEKLSLIIGLPNGYCIIILFPFVDAFRRKMNIALGVYQILAFLSCRFFFLANIFILKPFNMSHFK